MEPLSLLLLFVVVVCRGWSDDLELSEQRSQHRQLRSPVEDEAFSAVFGAPSAFRGTVR